ncbi:hypothetical protein [Mesorhizobium sp.]|uniref:hypothetical protein n=1 Tax=Mesorhizobium sp. TaxID=1871066 RepID=UPI0011FC3440|nr:hypothetical protein [Mesorhizobium sp.]TIN82207.1 MAG: hypothetical protein E5X97_31270 [Mesorhizobium sp.]
MTPIDLASKMYGMLKAQSDEVYLGDDKFLSSVTVDGHVDLVKIAAEIIALDIPVREQVGIVMKNSGGSANPATAEKVIRALRGERVSFVGTPIADDPPT